MAAHGWSWRVLGAALCIILIGFGTALGQSVSSGAIHGVVRDEQAGVLPGVTVTLSSPALQVPELVQVTDAEGEYRFIDLPAGTYRLKFELGGFSTLLRDELRLTVGFTARVDESLKVGTMAESITVSGQSPVVDITSTSAAVAFTKETLEAIPRGRDLQNIFAMAPGVTQAQMDVGGSTLAARQNISSYGVAAQPKLQYEGMNISMGADQNTPIYFNDNSLEEVQVKTSGTDAEVSTPGISMIAIMKSGGNTFHGQYGASMQLPGMQGNNLNDELKAQGLNTPPKLDHFYDVMADLGGRIVKDKLWFYGGYSNQTRSDGTLGFAENPGPDGRYLTGDEPQAYFESSLYQYSAKLSYQMSRNNRLVYAYQQGVKAQPQNAGDRFRPLEATRDYKNPTSIQKGEWQGTLSQRMLANTMFGYTGYVTDYDAARSYASADKPPRQDLETTLRTGSHEFHQDKTRDRYQLESSVTFFPEKQFAGQHDFKTGVTVYWDRTSDVYNNNLACNCVLITDRVNGVSGTPFQIRVYNTPVAPLDNEDIYAWYLKDSWRVTDKMTLNLGLRWERQHSYLPEQTFGGSRDWPTVFPAGSFPYIDVQTMNRLVPRTGIAYDLGGRSVVKATFGQYNYILGDTYADVYNKNATGNALFLWHDNNNDKLYQPGEVNLNLNGGDFRNITAAGNSQINPDLLQPTTWETTVSYERELAENFAIRGMYIYKTVSDSIEDINTLRPYSAYSIPITRRDPGPDGALNTADDAGKVTMYDYSSAYAGAAFVNSKKTNADNTDSFHSIEFTMTKRSSTRWSGQISYFAVKNHRFLSRIYNSPNDEFFPIDESWAWAGNINGTYRMPYGISVSGFLQSKSGVKGQRTNIFRSADPDGGPPIAQSSTITLRLEPYGTQSLSAYNLLNLRANKDFRLGGSRRLSVDFDLFNVLNSATPTGANFASGTTFGYATGVVPPRISRIGVRFNF